MDYAPALPWTLESLDLSGIDRARIRHNEELFLLLCSSSFVEHASHLYTHDLIAHFNGDEELQTWLSQHWEHEEQQHGRALAAYVRAVWPEFDWDRGFAAFVTEYGAARAAAPMEASRGLELAARCVVETNAASFYRALHEITDEPVLEQLTGHIKSDEMRHFKYFYQYFRRYRENEGLGRYRVFRAVLRRANEIRGEDSDIALRHVFEQCYPQHKGDREAFRKVAGKAQELLRRHVPAGMTIKMLLKPLDFPPRLQGALERPLARLAGKLFLD